ncbi:MAG: hypothetical protein CSA74_11845 [Rhodobacterales bacterium]|nr:MAG: hypothetical protein CSA74_11845 [Rhodobacterales bacterium]
MHLHAGRFSKCVAQLKERNIGVLRDQIFKERLIRGQLSRPAGRSLTGGFRMAPGSHLLRPARTCRRGQFQTQIRRAPT